MDFQLPIGDWGKVVIDFLKTEFRTPLRAFSDVIESMLVGISDGILFLPNWLFILLVALLAWRVAGRNVAILSVIGLLFIWNMGLWEKTSETLALVILSASFTLMIGFPLGILSAKFNWIRNILRPV